MKKWNFRNTCPSLILCNFHRTRLPRKSSKAILCIQLRYVFLTIWIIIDPIIAVLSDRGSLLTKYVLIGRGKGRWGGIG